MATEHAGRHNGRPGRGIVLIAVLCEGSLCGLAWLLAYAADIPLGQSFVWNAADIVLGVLASLPLFGIFFLCIRWPVGPLRGVWRFCRDVIVPLFSPCAWYELAAIGLLAGLGEEMLFRGVLQVMLTRWVGLATALVAVSLVFGLLHPITPAYAFIAGLMGLYLGCLFAATDNLVVPIMTHGVYDFVALAYLARGPLAPKE